MTDWYQQDYYPSAPDRNPAGPGSGTQRVIRGEDFSDSVESDFRAAYRFRWEPDNGTHFISFRCARTASDVPLASIGDQDQQLAFLSSIEGVWQVVRTGQDSTDGGTSFPSERTLTLEFYVEGTTLRGSLTTRGVGTLPSENYWVDEVTSERCGGAPDGRVRHTEGRQPLEGSVHGDGSVTFTTSSGESIVDDCGLLQKHGPDRLLDTGTFNGELSPDGGSITLDWEWADFLGGGNMILSRVDEGSQRLGSVDPGVRGDINILIVYENRFDEKLQELLSQLRGLGYDPSLGNVSEGFSCTANARSLALGGRTNGAVLDELRDITNGVMPGFFTEWLDETESNHIYLCESEG